MYQRKTKDIYELWTNYGYGWECEVWEETRAKIKQRYKEYRENTNAELKIKKCRERLEEIK